MFTKKSLFSFVIFSFFINLFFIGAANAEPLTMTGSNQMSVNQSQTFTAAGGYGGYTWSLEGNGTLSGTDDPSVTYTAPATNPNCTTTKICVADFRNKKYCKYIAINTYYVGIEWAWAYQVWYKAFTYPPNCYRYQSPNGTRMTASTSEVFRYNCYGEQVDWNQNLERAIGYLDSWCDSLWPSHATAFGAPEGVLRDLRTPAMKAAGCCPAALLPPDEVPDDEPYVECIDGEKTTCTEIGPDGKEYTGTKTCNGGAWGDCEPNKEDETGNNCSVGSVKSNSKVNVKSGNLYHDQDVGTFTFSYNGIDNNEGTLGKKWTHNYNQQITLHSDNNTLLFDADDGNAFLFTLSGSIYYPRESSSEKSQIIKNADGTFTRALKNGTIETYNTDGKLTSVTERNGKTTALTYSGNDLVSITDANGRTTNITNSDGKITAITNPAGQTYTLAYTNGLLAAISDPANNNWQFTYDSNGHMLTKKDPSDNTVTYTYDDQGRILTSTDPEGLVRAMSYGADNITTFTEKDGGVWTYKYDPILVAIIEKTDPLGNTTTYTYDEKRHLIATTYPDGTATTNTYDENGNLTSSTDALGNTTTYTYNEQNLVTSITDAVGKQTQYSYDAQGNMIAVTDPAGATTQYSYDARGNITSITNPLGKTTTMAYDQYNNLISVTDPAGAKITMTYDNLGNMTSQTDAAGNKTTFQYNNLNQMIKITDTAGKQTNYTYDASGNVLTTTDANGNTTTNKYNYKNQLIQTTDALGQVTRFTYGATSCGSGCGGTDKLTAVTDAKNQTTTYEYNQAGLLIRETDPLGNVTSYQYDAKGNMIAKTKPDGRTINYIHDDAGRLLERRYPNNTADIFQYDQTGNLIMATTNQNIAYYYAYDAAGRLTGVTDSNLRNIEYLYDAAGNRISMKTPEGKTISYEYNANNQLTKITANGKNFTFAYDNLNRRIKRTLPNGTYTTYSYDQNSRLTNITHKNNHNKIIDAFSYTHDNVGNRLTKTEEGNAPDKTTNYTYDAIYRLQATEPEKRGRGKLSETINKYQTENYTYDAVGNRQSGPGSKDSYSYNAGNELITSTGRIIFEKDNQYEYDLNGNLIKKTQTIKGKWKLITTYAYDDENRLIEVKIQKGHKIKEVSFTYDPLGRRISKTVGREDFEDEDEEDVEDEDKDEGKGKDDDKEKGKWGRPFQPRTTYYVYDDQNIIAEYDENNRLIASYVHGPNIDEPLSAEIRRDWIYYHADGLGSITTLTSHMGNVVQKYEYDSFGNMTPTPKWIKQPYTYTAREFDPETGLYYYRARYYDAKAGRFITRDPIGFEGGDINVYVYVGNNPVNFVDPSGETVTKAPSMTSALPLPAVMKGLECMSQCLKATIIIGSGWRTKEQNDKLKDASKNSYHLFGMAADLYTPPSQTKLRQAAKACGFFVLSKAYTWGIHVDIRGGNPKGEPDECECQKIREGR
jgi:RHS repeat-associated protein